MAGTAISLYEFTFSSVGTLNCISQCLPRRRGAKLACAFQASSDLEGGAAPQGEQTLCCTLAQPLPVLPALDMIRPTGTLPALLSQERWPWGGDAWTPASLPACFSSMFPFLLGTHCYCGTCPGPPVLGAGLILLHKMISAGKCKGGKGNKKKERIQLLQPSPSPDHTPPMLVVELSFLVLQPQPLHSFCGVSIQASIQGGRSVSPAP